MRELDRILSVVSEVRRRLVRVGVVLAGIFGFLILFELVPLRLSVLGLSIPFAYPWPSPFYNVTAQVFRAMVVWMLPSNVSLLNVGVADSIVAQMEIGLLLTIIVGMPWIVHEAGAFLVPALRKNERALLREIGIPASALFALGTAIGVFVLTPFTFRLLFLYVAAMNLAPVLGVQSFVTFALLYSLAFGVVFELPVFLYALTRLRRRASLGLAQALAGRGARRSRLWDDRHARQLRDHDAADRAPDVRFVPRGSVLRNTVGAPSGPGGRPTAVAGSGLD